MPETIKIDHESQVPVYKQIVGQVEALVRSGEYAEGCLLPSMNELSAMLDISKETVKKAYSILRNKGFIDARQGKGFYVSAAGVSEKMSVLVLFDKLSNYKQVLFNSFAGEIGDAAEITIRLHNQNVDLLEYYVEENLDLFDYYVITPHFPLDAASQKRVLKILTRIPNRKLILVDHWMKELPGNYGAVYQDFANDAYEGLGYGLKKLKTCSRFNVVTLPSSLYYASVGKAVERFCRDNGIAVEFHTEITPEIIREKEVYLILNSQYDLGLIELVRRARERNYRVGRDISIISYNESPINEIILNGLTTISTDFRQMGVLAVKKAVQEDNSTVRILRKNASAIEDAAGGSSFGSASVSPGATYSELADTLEKILESGTLDGDTKKAYEAQITALRGNAENMNLSVSVQYQSSLAMLSQLDDQAYQLRRQADSIANQMAMAAQNLLYTMETLDCQMESLKNGIATLDRNLAVMKVQRSRGMIGQLQLDTVENQRVQLVNSQQTLANMREQIGLSLSQLCGLDADTLVEPSTLIMPYEGELDRINAKTGLENAKKNSFDIWSRRVSLRAAQNVYDKNISGTAEAVKAAEDQLAVTQESVETAYATVIQNMKDSRVSLTAAQNALTQAQDDLRLASVKYKLGTMSRLSYQSAEDAVKTAEINVRLAELTVAQNYTACQWAEQGVLTLPTGV